MSNYTTEQTRTIIKEYKDAPKDYEAKCEVVQELADRFGTTVHSVRAVLVQASCYVKKTYKNKSGKHPITKDRFVTLMEEYFQLMPGRLESLTKVNKTVLVLLMKKFIELLGDEKELFKDYL